MTVAASKAKIKWQHTENQRVGYNAKLAQKYASYTPKAGVSVADLAISFSNDRGTAIASWTAVANASGYEVLWYYKLDTTSGAKWLAASTSYQNVGNVTTTSYSVPAGAVAIDVYVRPVSATYTYQWQVYEKKTETQKYRKGKKTKTATRTYYVYTTKSETRSYFTGAAVHVAGGAATDAADMPSAPDAPSLSLGADGASVNVELSSTSGTYLKVWLGVYVDGAWGNHSGGKAYGPYESGEVDVANVFTAERGHSYKVDARQLNTVLGTYSDYSSFSDELEMPPMTPTGLNVATLSASAFRASWEKAGYTGDSYELRWASDPDGMTLDDPPDGVQSANVTGGATTYSGTLAAGTWYFCVRACGEGDSDWSPVKKVVTGLTPGAPTLGDLPAYVTAGDPIPLSWTYNNADGSAQAAYHVQKSVDGGTWSNVADEVSGSASTLSVSTSGISSGSSFKLRVRTKGATDAWGDWAESASISVDAPITATIEVTEATIPLVMEMAASSDVRSWHLVVVSAEDAPMTGADGSYTVVPAGSVAFEGVYSYGDEGFEPDSMKVELDLAVATLAHGVEYAATLTVVSAHGLTDTDTATFTPEWDSSAPVPYVVIPDPGDDYVAHIFPVCRDWDDPTTSNGATTYPLRDDVTLSVYRIDSDGHLLAIAEDLENTGSVEVVDPHPSFGECTYRVAARATDGSLGFVDESCYVDCESVVIQFETGLRGYSDDGFDGVGVFELPYDIEIGERYGGDAALVGFIGNPDPTLYTGTQLGRTASVKSTIITSDDPDVVSRVRMLAGNQSRAYYRDPTGLGFWAWVVPSLDWKGPEKVEASFSVTRIMGDYRGEA